MAMTKLKKELPAEMKERGEREGRGGKRKSKSRGTTLNDLGITRDQKSGSRPSTPKLADVGITRDQALKRQKLAGVALIVGSIAAGLWFVFAHRPVPVPADKRLILRETIALHCRGDLADWPADQCARAARQLQTLDIEAALENQ